MVGARLPDGSSLELKTWYWNDLSPGCVTGFYLNDWKDLSYPARCEATFEEIEQVCASNSSVNAGSVNVWLMPDFEQDGLAVRRREAMYILAPERLTL